MTEAWESVYSSLDELKKYGDNGLGLFALSLRFRLDDLDTVATDAVVDGPDDKKCDIVYVNREDKFAVLMQCYNSQNPKKHAPSNKASDLNTALTWLLQRNLDEIPARLRPVAGEIREGLRKKEIETLYIWYVHNLPESKNVEDELKSTQNLAHTIMNKHFGENNVQVHDLEVGKYRLRDWYEETTSSILVTEKISLEGRNGYEMEGPNWKAYSTAIPAKEIFDLYQTYKESIFSANVRDYLGIRRNESNINQGIKETVSKNPQDFWVFNNGLTILTNKFTISRLKIEVEGISIVNGAQTTGVIGTLKSPPSDDAWVQVRFVQAKTSSSLNESDIIQNVIRYNNSQNTIEASDFRSTDPIQKRLRKEFDSILNAEYDGGRRSNKLKKKPSHLSSYTVGQSLASLHGEPIVAYNDKKKIWSNNTLYNRFFNEKTTAEHIVFSYSLIKCLERIKMELIEKEKREELIDMYKDILAYFRKRGSIYLLATAISECLETISERNISDKFTLSFSKNTSPEEGVSIWKELIDSLISFCTNLNSAIENGLKNKGEVDKACKSFRNSAHSTKIPNKKIYEDFSKNLIKNSS